MCGMSKEIEKRGNEKYIILQLFLNPLIISIKWSVIFFMCHSCQVGEIKRERERAIVEYIFSRNTSQFLTSNKNIRKKNAYEYIKTHSWKIFDH